MAQHGLNTKRYMSGIENEPTFVFSRSVERSISNPLTAPSEESLEKKHLCIHTGKSVDQIAQEEISLARDLWSFCLHGRCNTMVITPKTSKQNVTRAYQLRTRRALPHSRFSAVSSLEEMAQLVSRGLPFVGTDTLSPEHDFYSSSYSCTTESAFAWEHVHNGYSDTGSQ